MSSAKIKTSITYNEHVSVALIIQHAMHMVPYCHLWPVRPFIIFPHNLVSIMILKKIWTQMCVSIFSSTYVWSIFRSKKNWLRYNQNNKLVFMNSTCCYFDIVMEIEFTWQFFFWKILIPYFMKLHQVGAESFHADGQTYWWTDMMNLLDAFHYFANVPNDENLGWYMIYRVTYGSRKVFKKNYSVDIQLEMDLFVQK